MDESINFFEQLASNYKNQNVESNTKQNAGNVTNESDNRHTQTSMQINTNLLT